MGQPTGMTASKALRRHGFVGCWGKKWGKKPHRFQPIST